MIYLKKKNNLYWLGPNFHNILLKFWSSTSLQHYQNVAVTPPNINIYDLWEINVLLYLNPGREWYGV